MTEKARKWIAANKAKKASAPVAEVIEVRPKLIKVTHAAKYLDVSIDFVEDLIKKGIFKRVVKMNNKMRFLYMRDVDMYVSIQTLRNERDTLESAAYERACRAYNPFEQTVDYNPFEQ